MGEKPETPSIARYVAAQSAAELVLGSAVHAFHLPLGGHILSLNQALILSFSARASRARGEAVASSCAIGNASALLKSLSPAGAKLSPMIAIAAQGFLFAAGVACLGASFLGAVLGAVLLSLWAFVHPLLGAYVFFGSSFFGAAEKAWRGLAGIFGIDPAWGAWILATVIALKALAAAAVASAAWFGGPALEARYLERIEARRGKWLSPPIPDSRKERAVRPVFWLSFAMSFVFFLLSGNATLARAALYVARVAAAAMLCSWVARSLAGGGRLSGLAKRIPAVSAAASQLFDRSRS